MSQPFPLTPDHDSDAQHLDLEPEYEVSRTLAGQKEVDLDDKSS